jgi:DNA topoisomerase-2
MASADSYEHLSEIEHVRARSDMYIGSIKTIRETRWVIKENGNEGEIPEISYEEVESNPGLEQCILELIVNAADHAERCKTTTTKVTKIKITQTDEYFSIMNNGAGLPIEINKKMKMYVPEMIFGNLRTSSNYDDNQKRTVGGKNGIGAKAANIFSKRFVIEVKTNGQKYYQEFSNGMTKKTEPKITKDAGKDNYTMITFYPDFKAFGMESFKSNEIGLLIKKRIYDLSAATGKETCIFFNEKKLGIKDFSDYMNIYINKSPKVVYKTPDGRWEIGFAKCPYQQAVQVSFVNAICTEDGGTHVNHVLTPVIRKITEELQKKSKGTTILSHYIKDNIIIFIKSLIENPGFSSQLKRKLETKVSDFGSKCEIPDEIIKKIEKLGILDGVVSISKAKEMNNVIKSIDNEKKTRLSDIKKLNDATWAGTSKSSECSLLLTEGDSAKGLALNGIPSAGGQKKWGVFPLRGKFINIRGASIDQLKDNEEIKYVNRILGLKLGEPNDFSKLRYGKVVIFTDSDSDGAHIKGLLINYFTFYWPKLVEKGFLECMITPLVKVFKSNKMIQQFYNIDDYKKWANDSDTTGTREKYYKGLGTSTAAEAKEYFSDLESNRKQYTFNEKNHMPLIVNIFDGEESDYRKNWITDALENPSTFDYTLKSVPVDYFINKELVQFSIYSVIRSIPSVIDGLKPSQRKILFGCLKKKLFIKKDGSGEIKVAQLSGYISEHTAYHHGEVSLQAAIVAMAQEYVGSGNLNMLIPKGNFGSRLQGGKDAASSRYIFTALRPEVKTIYNEYDNTLLNYLEEEGDKIEPDFYVPIIPMILLNGCNGIGTGWSTNIPCFKLETVVTNIKLLLNNPSSELIEMIPYYKGFKGDIVKISQNEWMSIGCIKYINKNTIEITEIPIGVWKQDYMAFLIGLEDDDKIKKMEVSDDDKSKTVNDICFNIKLNKDVSIEDNEELLKLLKLKKSIKGTNMMAFNKDGIITKYGSANDIIWEFYKYRLGFYEIRKNHIIGSINKRISDVSEKLTFITLVVEKKIVIFEQKKVDIIENMKKHKLGNTDILLKIPIYKFTREEIDDLKKELDEMNTELKTATNITICQMWTTDLDQLEIDKLSQQVY